MTIAIQKFYFPLPTFGVPLSNQWNQFRDDFNALAPIVRAAEVDISNQSGQHDLSYVDVGELDFRNRFRVGYDKTNDRFVIEYNTNTEASPIWTPYLAIRQGDGRVTALGPGGLESTSGFYNFGNLSGFYLVVRESFGDKRVFDQGEAGIVFDANFFYLAGVSNSNEVLVTLTPSGSSGEVNTASNLGAGQGLFAQKVSSDLQFKSITGTSPISISASSTAVNIASSAEANTGSSLGGDVNVFKQKSGVDLQFRGLTAGTNISFSQGSSAITINAKDQSFYLSVGQTDDNPTFHGINTVKFNANSFYVTQNSPNTDEATINLRGTPGEVNTGSSLGGDVNVFSQKSGVDLQFRGLTAGRNVTLTQSSSAITIDSDPNSFYGIIFKESNAGGTIEQDDTFVVDSAYFYLSSSSDGKPILSLHDIPNPVSDFIVGDQGVESGQINLGGTTFDPVFSVSVIGGPTKTIQSHIHRHSTNLPASLLGTRTRSNDVHHSNDQVQNGDRIFSIAAAGRGDSTYEIAGAIDFTVDALDGSTPGNDNMPGRIDFRLQPPGSGSLTPPVAMSIRADASIEMQNTLNVENQITAEAFYVKDSGELITGITAKETDGDPSFSGLTALNFNSNDFYITQNNINTEATINFRGVTLDVRESDGIPLFRNINLLSFNANEFYLTQGSNTNESIINRKGFAASEITYNGGASTALIDTYNVQSALELLDNTRREVLQTTRIYYVRTDGSDNNTGLSNTAAGAFATIQKAFDVVSSRDLANSSVTIKLGVAGTYAGGTLSGVLLRGAGSFVTLLGDTGDPDSYVISSQIKVQDQQALIIKGVDFTTSGRALLAVAGASISITDKVVFGTCGGQHMTAQRSAVIQVSTNYTIDGSATIHMDAIEQGFLQAAGVTVTVSGTPNFSGSFANATRTAVIVASSNTYNGSATGTRYTIVSNGVIDTVGGGANYFPGDAGGTTATGGQYI